MVYKLDIILDGLVTVSPVPKIRAGELLRGTVVFESNEEVYLRSITLFLRWIGEAANSNDGEIPEGIEAEIEDKGTVFGIGRALHRASQAHVSRALRWIHDVKKDKVADQRKIMCWLLTRLISGSSRCKWHTSRGATQDCSSSYTGK